MTAPRPTVTGTFELWNGALVAFEARRAEIDDDGLQVYRVELPLFVDEHGTPLLIRDARIDVLPARSTLALEFGPDLPPVTVPAKDSP